jgi:protein-S-isoprenylcysteine O-methyltransferase Ste14
METRERQLWWRHLISFLVAPVTMAVVIPALIVVAVGVRAPNPSSAAGIGLVSIGGLLIAGGLALLIWTVALFDRVGKGTLGVGRVLGEPVHLVVRGPYRHVRNPMISGVVCLLLGEAAITASGWLLVWAAIFFTIQAIVIRFWEEPHLVRRYGGEYVDYRDHVPGWIPSVSAWDPGR